PSYLYISACISLYLFILSDAGVIRRSEIIYAGICNGTNPSSGHMCGNLENQGAKRPPSANQTQDCDLFYTAREDDNCIDLSNAIGVSTSDFWAWNTAVQESTCPVTIGNVYCLAGDGPCKETVQVTDEMTCEELSNMTRPGYTFLDLNPQIGYVVELRAENGTGDAGTNVTLCNEVLETYRGALVCIG
ncbi:hypothetical protein B0H14DRAFT_1595863, partial [Mycena olivaceomarginata]